MQSTMGAHHGASRIHALLCRTAGSNSQIQENFEANNCAKIRAFIDDITIQGTTQGLCNAVQHVLDQGETFGIKLNFKKVKIYIGDCSTAEAQQRLYAYQRLFDNLVPLHHISLPSDAAEARGIEVLNVPLGSDDYVQKKLTSKSKDIEADLDIIQSLTNVLEKYKLTIPIALAFNAKSLGSFFLVVVS
jgi:hypothetical protein